MVLFLVIVYSVVLHYHSLIFSLTIEDVAPPDNPNYKPQWVSNAISKDSSLEKSNSMSQYCQSLKIFKDIEFPGKLCFVSTWKDISLLEIKLDPRRQFCEALSWGFSNEFDEICTLLDKTTSNCYGNYDIILKQFGYIPTICPQFPCRDFKNIKIGFSNKPRNQIIHIKQPNDESGLNINNITLFDSSNLGYIRISKNNQTFKNSNDCPSDMYGLSYYWDNKAKKSCTILSKQQSVSVFSDDDNEFIDKYCRNNANKEFLGCIYVYKSNCISSLQNPEYLEIFKPTKLRVNINIFIESHLIGNDNENELTKNDKLIENDMSSANNEDNSVFSISSKLSIGQFSFSFSEITHNFRICTDELFNLQSFISLLNPQTTLKFCIRLTNFRTFMPENGKLYVRFIPHFSVTIRKISSMSSLGFSGGIEYTLNAFTAFLNLQKPTNWLNRPSKTALIRDDLKWFKPIKIQNKSQYKNPPNFTIIGLTIFLGIMIIYFILMFKNYLSLKKEEESWIQKENQRKKQTEKKTLEHEKWEKNIIENEKKYKQELNNKLLTKDKLSERMSEIAAVSKEIKIVNSNEIKKNKLDEYSDIEINEDELNELMNDNNI